MSFVALALAAGVLLSATEGEQGPADPVDEAKTYFEAGRQAYEAGDYVAAASAFEEAQARAPRPAIVFSMAQAYRQQYFLDHDASRLKRAIELYAKYLQDVPKGGRRNDAVQHLTELQHQLTTLGAQAAVKTAPPESKTQLMVSSRTPAATASIDGSELQEVPLIAEVEEGKHSVHVEAEGYEPSELSSVAVKGRLVVAEVNLKEKPAIIRLSAPDGADVSIDGRPLGEAPLLFPLQVTAGDHVVAVTERGAHPFVREMKLGRGEEVSMIATLDSTAQRDVSYVFLGGTAAMVAGTAIVVVVALVSEGEARFIYRKLEVDRKNLTIEERDRYNVLQSRRNDLITASTLLLAGTIGLGATGGLLYFLDEPGSQVRRGSSESPLAASAAVAPLIAPDTLGLQVGGSF